MKKVNPVVIVIQILVGLEYAAVFGLNFLNPIDANGFGRPYKEISFGTLSLAILGMSGLSYALRNIKEREEVWLWLLISVGLAPFAGYAGGIVGKFIFRGVSAPMVRTILPCAILGFYVPFVLVAFKLKNKYREAES